MEAICYHRSSGQNRGQKWQESGFGPISGPTVPAGRPSLIHPLSDRPDHAIPMDTNRAVSTATRRLLATAIGARDATVPADAA